MYLISYDLQPKFLLKMSDKITYIVNDELHGKRLDAVIAALNKEYSRSVLQDFIEKGKVRSEH